MAETGGLTELAHACWGQVGKVVGTFPSFISNHCTPWSLQSKQLSDLEGSHDVRRSKYHSAATIILIRFWPAVLAKFGNHPTFIGDSKSIMSMCNLRSALRDSPRELHGGRNSLLATHQYCKSIRCTPVSARWKAMHRQLNCSTEHQLTGASSCTSLRCLLSSMFPFSTLLSENCSSCSLKVKFPNVSSGE